MKLSSLEAIARALNSGGVSFILVGGLAVNAHGYGRLTQDVDIVVRLDDPMIRSAFAAFASLGYAPRVPITADQFADRDLREGWIADKGMTVLNFHSERHRETPVDVFVTTPFDFDDEYRVALVEEIAPGVPIRIVSYPTLIRMKQEAGRPQDLADIDELVLVHGDPKGD